MTNFRTSTLQLILLFFISALLLPSATCQAQTASPSPSLSSSSSSCSSSSSVTAESLPYKYTGNLITHKFHRPRCPYCRVMAEAKRQRFHFRCQAVEQGYVPCRYCLPPIWTTVRATIHLEPTIKTGIDPGMDPVKELKAPPLGVVKPESDISKQ